MNDIKIEKAQGLFPKPIEKVSIKDEISKVPKFPEVTKINYEEKFKIPKFPNDISKNPDSDIILSKIPKFPEGEILSVNNSEKVEDIEADNAEKDIIPEDYLTENQIETIKDKYEKLGYTDEEIAIKEYALEEKSCKEAEERGLDNLSKKEKGNYGEMKADLDMLDKGYVRISKDGVTDLNQSIKQGIDGVYQNPDGKPPYVVLDAKFGSSQLRDTQDGKQLSDTWIAKRLDDAVGKEKADEIRESMIDDDVDVAVARIYENGNVTYTTLDFNESNDN